ncbi:hypothetical protein ESCO_005418 [Escovopsis weberi]|uniref:Myb-like DNA-binding domain-containing protein n=1 Tax=Escovopsis weberi TaxID=150374 RepID=A0A0M9VV24_ESCWE|nr:hypothetical protein ESCO_005418 [Escovopsis weberi]
MSKTDPSEQVRFLVSCIGHTSNGRPDFAAVAEELGIVTKAAAQKRYERMLKAHGVSNSKHGTGKISDGEDKPVTPRKRKPAGAPATGSAKKTARGKAAVKDENSGEEKKSLKKEQDDESSLSDAPSTPSPYS